MNSGSMPTTAERSPEKTTGYYYAPLTVFVALLGLFWVFTGTSTPRTASFGQSSFESPHAVQQPFPSFSATTLTGAPTTQQTAPKSTTAKPLASLAPVDPFPSRPSTDPPPTATDAPRLPSNWTVATNADSFQFGVMPTWGYLPKNVFLESQGAPYQIYDPQSMATATNPQKKSRSAVLADPLPSCFPINGSAFDATKIVHCLKEAFRVDRRSAVELAKALLVRPRSISAMRRNENRSCTMKNMERQTGHYSATLFIQPPNVVVVDASEDTYHYFEQIFRVVRRPTFVERWNRLKNQGTFLPDSIMGKLNNSSNAERDSPRPTRGKSVEEKLFDDRFYAATSQSGAAEGGYPQGLGSLPERTTNQRWSTAEGFPLILQFSDFANEDQGSCVMGCYAERGVFGTSYTAWDPYFAYTGDFPSRGSRSALVTRYAVELFGPEWASGKILSTETEAESERILEEMIRKAEIKRNVTWRERRPKVYFRGNPTDRLREFIGGSARFRSVVRGARNLDVVIKHYYRGNPKAAYNINRTIHHEPFQDSYRYKAVLSLRGKNAALRDRMLPFAGAAIVRVMNVDQEPMILSHDLQLPFVHYLPIVFRSLSMKLQKFSIYHLAKMDSVLSLLFQYANRQSQDDSLDRILEQMGKNNFRMAAVISSEEFRDAVMEEILFTYLQELDGVQDGPEAAPTTLEGAKKLCVHGIRSPKDLHLARNGTSVLP